MSSGIYTINAGDTLPACRVRPLDSTNQPIPAASVPNGTTAVLQFEGQTGDRHQFAASVDLSSGYLEVVVTWAGGPALPPAGNYQLRAIVTYPSGAGVQSFPNGVPGAPAVVTPAW